MPLHIQYSQRARFEYKDLIKYVVQKFGLDKATRIDNLFERIIFQISVNPKMYPIFDRKRKIRRCVISKQTSLYYRVSGKYLELISFRGNLMNPNKINLK